MEQVFSYIISLGASVMMPIIFTVIGLCIGMKFGKALKSGLFVGVGFVGLGVVTALLTTNFNDPLKAISDIYHLQLNVFDMGWPAAAAVAYNTAVGALIIPICLGVNFLMLITKTTRTVNIDLWNYWHFAFIGAVAYFVMGESLLWGYFAAIVCYIDYIGMCRPHRREVPEVLRFGWYLYSAAILPEFHAIRHRLQQTPGYDSWFL